MKSVNKVSKVAVIGSGVSGVAAAYYLQKKGYDVDIIESSSSVGGRIGSEKLGERWIDFGGKNIGYGYDLFREFVSNQGNFSYEYFGVNTSKVVGGKLIPINREKNFKSLLNIFKLANPLDLLKLLYLVRRVKKDKSEGLLGHPFYNKLADKFDHKSLRSHFGKKCSDNLLRPMTVRMNGAEPEDCFVGNLGSNLRIAFDKYDQIKEGMGSVIDAFADKTSIKYNLTVSDIVIKDGKVEGVRAVDTDGKDSVINYDAVVLAVPAGVASKILQSSLKTVCEYLDRIKYNPVGIMIAQYKKPVFDSEIRAVVFDDQCALSNAGAYGVNDLDVVRYTFSGKAAAQLIDQNTSKESLFEIIAKAMPNNFNVKNNELIDYSYRYFSKGLCSYSPHHYKNLDQINKITAAVGGLYLTGDYFCGAAIEACFNASKRVVDSFDKFNG